ncbi:MAG: mechanosensitive ion channel, partial [Oscillospiraceae bacterium]|nr:mechanosensitive ion channel [Oscillospiraceae bacterium]
IILFTKPFVRGDYISVCDAEGLVDSISILSTRMTTIDNKVIYIPNGQVSSSTIINFSKEDKRIVERKFSVSYSADISKVKSVINDVIAANEKIRHTAPIRVRVWDLDDSAVTFIVRVWAATSDYWDVWYDLAEQVKTAFDENGIIIPFPQMVVHQKDVSDR